MNFLRREFFELMNTFSYIFYQLQVAYYLFLRNIDIGNKCNLRISDITFHAIYADRPVEMEPMAFCTSHTAYEPISAQSQ